MKKLRIKKEYGVWYYESYREADMDGTVYRLFNADKEFINDFAYYGDMKYYIMTGIII